MEDSQPGFLPAERLWPKVSRVKVSKLKISLVGHAAVQCTHWKINLVKAAVRINLQCQRIWELSEAYLNVFVKHAACTWDLSHFYYRTINFHDNVWGWITVSLQYHKTLTLRHSSPLHDWSGRAALHLCNIFTGSSQASSINKTVWPVLPVAGSHQDGCQTHGNSTSQGTTTNIAHGENEGTKERNCVSLLLSFFVFLQYTCHNVPHAVAPQ